MGESAPTGDGVVDDAVARLDAVSAEVPLEEHVRVLAEVHDVLQHRLSATRA